MKPVVIIAIAVVCSVVAVLGVLAGLDESNSTRSDLSKAYDEYQRDLSLASSYNQEYLILKESLCSDRPPPTTYEEAKQMSKDYEKILREIAKEQAVKPDDVLSEWTPGDKLELTNVTPSDRLSELENKMKNLQKKYPNNSREFTFDTVTCPYAEEWDRAIESFREYQYESQP